MAAERLQKLIAQAGVCSRRRAEELLRYGRVTVNGQRAQLGDKADPNSDSIALDGEPLGAAAEPMVLLLNKPAGVLSSCFDPEGRPIVLDFLPPELARGQGLHPVGRLDFESRGALLLSNDGALTLELTHPRFAHRKTYRVWVQGRPSQRVLDQWARGVSLDGAPPSRYRSASPTPSRITPCLSWSWAREKTARSAAPRSFWATVSSISSASPSARFISEHCQRVAGDE